MNKQTLPFLFLAFVLSLFSSCQVEPERVTLIIAGGATGQDLDLTVAGTQRFMQGNPEVRVGVRPIPRTSRDRLGLYEQLLSAASDEVDVFQIDVVWIGILAEHALDLRDFASADEIGGHFPSMIDNNTIEGKLVALPWFADIPSLYYRSDLLSEYGLEGPPPTWEELERMARLISQGERNKGNLGFWGYIFQGADYEGLTCNALEWQISQGGGNLIGPDQSPNFLNPESAQAFQRAEEWVGTIAPAEVLDFDEEETRLVWERGDAAFVRNWSYLYSASQGTAVDGRFAVAPLPAGPAGSAATLGGWQLMVSKYSKHPEEAAELVRYLTSEREQKIRALEGSRNPTIRALYEDPEILEAAPFFRDFERIYHDLVTRPSSQLGGHYDEVSSLYSKAVHDILAGAEVEATLQQAQEEAAALIR